jgi:tetratricopeptide (TPR) repeat protein
MLVNGGARWESISIGSNAMMILRTLTIALLLAAATAANADTASYASREEAIRAAASPDADARAEALAWIASHGAQGDAIVLKEHLTDDSTFVRSVAEQSLWVLWSRSGDDAVDGLLAAGVAQMRTGDLDGAIATFSAVITQKPDFAEGWNKRATALFLAGEYRRSLADCDEVIKRNPLHFGALAGYGQIYFQLEQYERAIAYWKRALEVNPNMSGVETSIRATEQMLAERRRRGA